MTTITTVQQAVYPLLLTCSIFGIGIYALNKFYLNIFYILTIWISYGCLCYCVITALKAGVWFKHILNMVQTRIGIVIIIISIVMSVYQDKKFRLSMKRLAAVDDTLERLGTPKIYQKLHTYAKGVLIGWFVCSYVVNVFDMMWWFYAMKNYWCMILPYIINHYHHTAMLMDFLLMTFLWYIGTRFDKVNEHVRNLIVKENYGYFWRETIPNTRRYVMCTDYKPVLWTLMHLHLELCQIVRELNTIFGPQMTTELVAHLIFLARLCHLIYKHIRMKSQSLHTIVWLGVSFRVLLQLARLFSFNYICEKISIKANKMEKVIHELMYSLRYADVRYEIYQFSLQIKHHPLKFSGLGFFYFGNNLLRKFVTTITTFMIIIIQMSDE